MIMTMMMAFQIEKKLTQLLSAIYPTMQESSAGQLMQLNLIVRHVPRQYLLSIVKSYLQSSDELSQKKRHAISCSHLRYVDLQIQRVKSPETSRNGKPTDRLKYCID